MMVLERWVVAAIVLVGLVSSASGQSSSKPLSHRSKPKVVQPDDGTPPDQANQPDASTPLAQTPNYDPPTPPPRPPDPDPPPPAALQQVETPTPDPGITMVEKLEKPRATRSMTAEEQQLEKDSARLLTLVRELKEEVEKAGIDTLSVHALHTADEIQSLSKSLKERLKLQSQVMPAKTR